MSNRKRTSEMTHDEFMREFNLYKKEQNKNGSKRTDAQMERDFVREWDSKARTEAALQPQNRRTKAEWDKINAERMSKGEKPTVVKTKQKEETNQQTYIPEEYKGRFEGEVKKMSIPWISKEGFMNQFSKAQSERDKDEESKPSEQQLTKQKNDYSDVDPSWPRVKIIDEKGNKVEVPEGTKEAAQYVNAIFDNEDDRAKLRKAGEEVVGEILAEATGGAGRDKTNTPVPVNIKPREETPETINIQQSNVSTQPSNVSASNDTSKSVTPETKTTASTPQQTTQSSQITTKDRTKGGAEYVDNTDKVTGDVGSPSSTARPNVDNTNGLTTNQYNDMANKNNQNNPNEEEVQGSAVVAAPIDGGETAAQSGDNGGGVQPLIPIDVPEGGSQAANHWQAGVSASQSASQQEHGSQSQQTTKHVYAPAMTKEQVEEEYRRSPSAVSQIMPWIQDDLDPDKIAQRKKDANFRKGLHEAVESLRVLSDIGASFAGGQAYKRNAPDYKRYEDEKAKIDQARQNALGKLFEAMGKDRDYKRQLDALVLGKSLASITNTDSNGWQNGSQQQQGQQYSEGYQRQGGGNTIINNGKKEDKDQRYTVVKVVDKDGNAVGSQRVVFKNQNAENSYYDSLTKLVVGTNGTDNTLIRQAYKYAFRYGGDEIKNAIGVTSNMTEKEKQSKWNVFRSLLQGQEVVVDENGHVIKLTPEQRKNILGSVMLSEQQTRDILNNPDYEIVGFDDQTQGDKTEHQANPVTPTQKKTASRDTM